MPVLFSKPIICPYCFSSFPSKKLLWRCNSYFCQKKEKLEEDEKFHTYHQAAELKQPHILGKKVKVSRGYAKCDQCQEETNVRICPECHSKLPDSKENIIVSIIGAPGAGKSYYVGTLLRQLRSHICKFNCSLMFTTKDDEELYSRKFNINFEHGRVLDKTQRPSDENNFVGANMPILCDIQDKNNVTRTFTFFDAAGENFDDEAIMRAVAKYLEHSTAILLLLDPLQIEAVQGAIKAENPGANIRENEKIISYEEILHNVVNVLRAQLHLPKDAKINIPLAIAFSKWDYIENTSSLHRNDSIIANPSPHFTQGFDVADCENVSIEVASRLSEWGYENFLNTVNQNFKDYRFFAFSAIGAAPEPDGKIPKIVSKRVEDPFLWLLNKRKIIVK